MTKFDLFKATLPVAFGYIPLGCAYGILAFSNGISPLFAVLFSVIVYAGSAQFLLVAMVGLNASLAEIFIAILLINLRHFFYTLCLLKDIKRLKRKFYAIFSLTDETFAVLKSLKTDDNNRDEIYFKVAFLNQIYWILGTIVGVVFANLAKFDFKGIEFALIALFGVIATELFRENKNAKILVIGLFSGLFGVFMLPQNFMLIGSIFIAMLVLFACKKVL